MKKRLVTLPVLLAVLLALVLPAAAGSARELPLVCDTCELLTEAQAEELEALAERYSEEYGCEIILVTVPDTGNYSADYFTEAVYSEYGYGWGSERSGVILLLSLEERDFDLAAYGYGNTAFTDVGKEWLMDDVLRYLKKDDWYGGFTKYIELCADYLRQAREGRPVDRYGPGSGSHNGFRFSFAAAAGAVVVGLLAALIVTAVLKAKMKSAVLQTRADNYRAGDLHLRVSQDRFLRKERVRVRRDSGSRGGGGGGTSIRSSGFSHHSGKF